MQTHTHTHIGLHASCTCVNSCSTSGGKQHQFEHSAVSRWLVWCAVCVCVCCVANNMCNGGHGDFTLRGHGLLSDGVAETVLHQFVIEA